MYQESKMKIDWKVLVPKKNHSYDKAISTHEIKSYLQELAGHEILISIVCNEIKDTVCCDFLNYLHSGNLFWLKYLKRSEHLNISVYQGNIKMLFKKDSYWKEILIDLKKDSEHPYQEKTL